MTTIYEENGVAQNSTLLEVGQNIITQIRKEDVDGYEAVQVGLKMEKSKKKDEFEVKEELRIEKKEAEGFKIGDELNVDQFAINDKVFVIGTTKGKGNQGVVKRHGFKGSPASHGHRHDLRAPGSIGCSFPERVLKGKKMAGRMGSDRCTVKNLKIVKVDSENRIIAIKGAIPGVNGSLVRVIGQ